MSLTPPEKQLLNRYATDVSGVARKLTDTASTVKDPQWKGFLRGVAEELVHVTEDVRDTVARL